MFCFLQFLLLPLVFSGESVQQDFPTNPDQYLTDDNANYKDKNYYANKQFFQKTKTLTNSLLSMHSCSFINILAENYINTNNGIVRIIINNDMLASLTGDIEIQNCKFIQNQGGDIHIECSSSKYFIFYKCKFISSEAHNGGAGVHFAATNGKIEDCHFLNTASQLEGGHIYFNPPNSNSNDAKFIVTNNLFEMDIKYYYGCIYLEKDNEMEITNNQIIHLNPYLDIRNKVLFTKSQTVNFQNWNIKNNFIFPFYNDLLVNADTNAGSTLPENAFKEGFYEECPTNNYPDSNEFMTECNEQKKDTIKASQSILKIYHCMFRQFTNNEETGGAIYISINGNLNINIQESIHIYKCDFDGMAANKGGAIYISSTESNRLFNVEECRFKGCAQGWSSTVDLDTTCGGAIYIEANSFIIKITKCFFELNTCGNGAAICFMYESSTTSYDESEISDDYAMLIFDCIFVNNEAYNRGGAIYVSIKNGEPSKQIVITKCIFYSNSAKQLWDHKEAIKDNPEEGGVIAFIYEAPATLKQFETKSENTNNFILNVFECLFYQNKGRNKGGCFYIDVTDREPTNPIGIISCSFNNNYGGDDDFDEGDAGDLYYVFKSSTSYKSIKSDSISSPCINLTNDIFTNSHAKVLGGSIVISILSSLASKSIEINSCKFTNCYSSGYSIEFTSSNPSVNLHMIDCKFQKQFSIYFNGVSGLIENCQFINIEGKNPIRYECNSNDNEVGNFFFKIQKCSFLQTNSMDCLVFIVIKSKSNFYFDYNHIQILDTTNKTWLFGCDIDAQNLGNWNFNSNSIFPAEDNFINNENAVKYNFPASCENGFLCGNIPSSTQEYDNLTGLINITCDKFNHIKNCGECHKPGSARGGSYVNIGGSLSYTFNGTRVHVVAFDQPNENSGGVMQISIDGKIVGTACPNKKDASFPVVFSSDYYPFGEHIILIEHISLVKDSSFYINSLLVDPLPKVGGHILGFNDISNQDGSWVYHSSKTPYFSTENFLATCTFKFHGTRFWLTGIRHKDYSQCALYIDGIDIATIDEKVNDFPIGQEFGAYGNQGILLYESDVLDFSDHTIEIMNLQKLEFCIINLIYTTQPYNAVVVPLEEISFDDNWKNNGDYYSAENNQSSASIIEYLDHFWVIGYKKTDQVKMNVYLNNQFKDQADISSLNTEFTNEVLFKYIYDISHDTYSVKIEKMGLETSSLAINYFYYLNEKTLTVTDESHFISSEEMFNNIKGEWKKDGDYIYTEEKDASTTIQFNGNKFWIYGKVHPNYGKIEIIFDGNNLGSVSFYSEKPESNVIMYESPKGYSQESHTLKIVNLKQSEISLLKIVYQSIPSETSYFSKSETFTKSGLFSGTKGLTKSEEFSKTGFFSQTGNFSRSSFFSKSEYFIQTGNFSRSNFFSKTEYFSQTGNFSRSSFFSESKHFSQTDKFTKTSMFSYSQTFSRSFAFTASQELPGSDVCILTNSEGNTSYDHCNFKEEERTDSIVHVLLSNFTDYIEDKRSGGAIHIINCGIDCTSVSFTHCVSNNGGGGAFYIKNWNDLVHSITMHNLSFKGCQALYGGAGYIYSSSNSNDVTITSSNFSDNVATEVKGTKENKYLFNGNHLFITSRNLLIRNCTFEKRNKKTKGSSVKIYNIFDQNGNKAMKLDDSLNNIQFSNCLFELDEESKSSINYIDNKITKPIEFVDCTFIGKVEQNKHYIDGEVASKSSDSIKINSCKFEYDNEQAVNFGVFKEDQIILNNELHENKNFFGLNSRIFLLIAFLVDLIVMAAIFIVLKLAKRNLYLNDLTD